MDRTIGFALKAFAGTVAASASMVGLAYAGVDLPGQAAEKAIEAVSGLELPNQDGDQTVAKDHEQGGKSVADDVRAVREGDLKGCEFGQAVSDAADANRQDEPKDEKDPCVRGDDEAVDQEASDGRANAAEKSKGRSEAKGSNAPGRTTASEKSNGASDAGADNADTKGAAGNEASDAGKANGSSKSDAGADNAGTSGDGGPADDASSAGQDKGAAVSQEHSQHPTDRP
jgi:hypothetical protein